MSVRAPYIVRVPEPGMAHVHDRETGELVGYVLQDFYGNWEPMRAGERCAPIAGLRWVAVQRVWATRPPAER